MKKISNFSKIAETSVLPKTAWSAQTQESTRFIWIVRSTLYLYLWMCPEYLLKTYLQYRSIGIQERYCPVDNFVLNIYCFQKCSASPVQKSMEETKTFFEAFLKIVSEEWQSSFFLNCHTIFRPLVALIDWLIRFYLSETDDRKPISF